MRINCWRGGFTLLALISGLLSVYLMSTVEVTWAHVGAIVMAVVFGACTYIATDN